MVYTLCNLRDLLIYSFSHFLIFSFLHLAGAKVLLFLNYASFPGNFFQKKMIYSFSNIFPTLDKKTKNYLHMSKKSSTFVVK